MLKRSKQVFTMEEVAKHHTEADCWVVVEGKVFDVTNFLQEHPGGKRILLREGGKDATEKFKSFHGPTVLANYEDELCIGRVGSEADMEKYRKKKEKKAMIEAMGGFGALVPYGDPSCNKRYSGMHSPYYTESHKKLRKAIRKFVEANIMPYVHEWDEQKSFPHELFKKLSDAGFLGCVAGAPWRSEYAGSKIGGGVSPAEFDIFHTLIIIDEVSRCGSGGVLWGLFGGLSIGLPPVLHFGSDALRDRIVPECLRGQSVICLAITEPYAGSDVANLQTTAELSADGSHYIVNGEKKWITNGTFADYFTTAVRTGAEGPHGVSLLLIERSMPGVKTKQMQCSGVWASGTAYVTFEDVKVPAENIIGKVNQGFRAIMYNFNHERFGMAVQSTRFARVCLEESINYAIKRRTFGKPLIQHQVIRHKLAEMARRVESTQCWLEHLTYQLKLMDHKTAFIQLGGPIALLKAHTSRVLEYCAREAQQIFGGLGYTRGGQGAKVERLAREVRAYAVPAGSEEIMFDLAVRQAERKAYAVAKALERLDAKL